MKNTEQLLDNINKTTIFCSNLGLGEQGAVLSQIPSGIFICPNVEYARKMKLQLDALNKKCVIVDDFDKPYTISKFSSKDNLYDLICAEYALTQNDTILISTPQILFSHIQKFDVFNENIKSIKVGENLDITELEKYLIKVKYRKVESVTNKGEFSRRGDVLDIFNIKDETATRIDFFDDLIEEIHTFDTLSYTKLSKLNEFTILPADWIYLPSSLNAVTHEFNKYLNINTTALNVVETIERGDFIPSEFIAPFTSDLIQVLNSGKTIIIADELSFETISNNYIESIFSKIELVFKDENLINIYKNNQKIKNIDEFLTNFSKNLIFFENFDINTLDLKNKLNSKILSLNYDTINFSSYLFNLNLLPKETSKYLDKQIYLCLENADTINSIKKIFSDNGIAYSLNKNAHGLILTDLKIPYNICFESEEKLYIGSANFAHKKEAEAVENKKIKYLPKAGEYVVHSTHGIGKCMGVVNMTVGGVEKEFFKLVYRGGDSLYVPTENADCLSLYMASGDYVTLNKLGGKEFAREKVKAMQSIEDMSKDLLEIYAKRKATKGFKYSEDDYLYTEFENAFPYTETNDQLQAIQDVKRDMISGKVMDRLICGDVGFGKTEVAMRALFKAVENGKQVAILAPTTILSLQHYMTAKSRTGDFGVTVEMLNRFRSSKEQKKILEDLASNKLNVICGTHRLLSSDVKFHDLGLLILDEEQRFGVKAKEQIKKMKANVDVLTLSATPIPRTLSMSLMNIRDISIINTPPVDRLPVKTYVLAYNEDIVVNAINEELNRGGQVLIVYNNVMKLPELSNRLQAKVKSGARFDTAHGQMSEIALENAIKRLYDRETDVFVSTTLIENGVDLPKANTLIVIDSDKLGLSQMYQLRGRVGRNTEQAYAYFTYASEKTLTEEASNRLQAIAENTDLGSGFKIAMRDLQIRGAGELLGKVQHGHMQKIGYDLYTKLLDETMRKLKGEKVTVEREVKLDIAISSKIPQDFVDDESERLQIIARISNITTKESARSVINDLLKKYNRLPKEVYQLAQVGLMRSLAISQKVKLITINKTRMAITFYEDVDVKELLERVRKYDHFKFENVSLPTITLSPSEFSVVTAQTYMIEFLSNYKK